MPRRSRTNKQIEYYGRFTLANFIDWLITLGLSAVIGYATLHMGGVRPGTNVVLLGMVAVLLGLHGLWLAVDRDSPKRLSRIPLLFLPLLAWMGLSAFALSPVPWRGQYEFTQALLVLIFFWVAVNNLRTRAHLWTLIILALVPAGLSVLLGFYQYFQNPGKTLGDGSGLALVLDPEFLGQATGTFADPNSFAALLGMLLPVLFVAAFVPRFPAVIRIFCAYSAVMFFLGILFAEVYWPIFLIFPLVLVTCWFCFNRVGRRIGSALAISLVIGLILGGFAFLKPDFREGVKQAFRGEGESGRLVIWEEAARIGLEHPIFGSGAGSFEMRYEQSPRVATSVIPSTPLNDYLLVFSQLGLVGCLLFLVPAVYVVSRAYREWKQQPYRVRMAGGRRIMPPIRFFLSTSIAGLWAYAFCMAFFFPFYVPALLLYGVLFLTILVKNSFERTILLPESKRVRVLYAVAGIAAGWGLYAFSVPTTRAQALELEGRQRLEQIVDRQIHFSGNPVLLERVIETFTEAVALDPGNADAWIGLSAAHCQRVFQNPTSFEVIANEALAHAEEALELAEDYWRAWAQYGVAQALRGDAEAAGAAFARALETAPNNSSALYYQAAFLSHTEGQRDEALELISRSLEIYPHNKAARRLQQLLLIP